MNKIYNFILLFLILTHSFIIQCLNINEQQYKFNIIDTNNNKNDNKTYYIQYQVLLPLKKDTNINNINNNNNNTNNTYKSKIKFLNLNKYFYKLPYIIKIINNNINISKEYDHVYLITFNSIPNNYYDDWEVKLSFISQHQKIISPNTINSPPIKINTTIHLKSPYIYNNDYDFSNTLNSINNKKLLLLEALETEKEIGYSQNLSNLLLSVNPTIYNFSDNPIKIELDSSNVYFPYPYGQGRGYNKQFSLDISVQRIQFRPITNLTFTIDSIKYIVNNISNNFDNSSDSSSNDSTDITAPNIITYDIVLLYDQVLLIRMRITDDISGVCQVELNDGNNKYYGSIVSGDKIDGVYELWYDSKSNFTSYQYTFSIYDNVRNLKQLNLGDQYGTNSNEIIHFPNLKGFSIDDIESIRFLYNYIDTSNKSYFNQIYIEFKNDSIVEGSISVSFIFSYSFTSISNLIYNNISKLWEGSFQIPSNLEYGDVDYRIISFTGTSQSIYISSRFLDDKFQLKIYSKDSDIIGPIFKNISRNFPVINNETNNYELGWSFTIIDSINGFKNGIISVKGDSDGSLYNFTINPSQVISGNQFQGDYQIKIIVNSTYCLPMNYTIIYIEFLDNNLYYTTFSKSQNINYDSKLNPFFNILNDVDPYIDSIQLNCPRSPNPPVYPSLLSFNLSSDQVDTTKLNQKILLEFEVYSLYGFKEYQFPSVFLQTSELNYIRFQPVVYEKSVLVNVEYTHYKFNTTLEFPNSYGYPNDLSISIYGLISKGATFMGYSSLSLAKLGLPYKINTSVISYPENQVLLESAIFSNKILWIRGKGLKYIESISISGIDIPFIPINEQPYESLIKVLNYEPISSGSIQITAKITGTNLINSFSNSIDLFIVSADYISPFSLNNPKQECIGEPLCGGGFRGTCNSSIGCVCNFPFVGPDCNSEQIIIKDAPKVNIDQPSFQLIVNNNEKSNSGDNTISTPIIVTNISLIELRELNINGEIINIQMFKGWYFSVSSMDSSIVYTTNITNKDGSYQTLVQVTLKWYDNQEDIRYANENYKIDPATMKMTIYISEYRFESPLNTLELIMFNSIYSLVNQSVSCSNIQFGYTTEKDFNFVKLQVDNHSLYGKFIRRSILDNHIQQVINEPINSTINQNSAETLISIKLPHYSYYLILDPTFSVLLDYNTYSSDKFGKCFSSPIITRSIGLIVGLVIGIFAFIVFIIIFLVKLIYKHPSLIDIKIIFLEIKNKIIYLKKNNK